MTTFNIKDPVYQANEKFKPDKEELYHHPAETDGWVHAHNAIRAELRMIQECIESIQTLSKEDPGAISLRDWQVKSLQAVFMAHYSFVHTHHKNEDDILAPKVAERVVYPKKLTADHDGIVEAMEDIKKQINDLKAGDEVSTTMPALLNKWTSYRKELEEHLMEEEEMGLPLVRAYFTPKEYGKMTQEIIANEGKLEMGSFVYHMGAHRMRGEFMKQEGIPFFVWYLVFRGGLKLYEKQVMVHAEALKSGMEPVSKRGSLLGC